jgi:ACS family allantoate permease-like MFS transporter
MATIEGEKKQHVEDDIEKDIPGPLADAIRSGSVDKNILKHSHDADEALKAFASHQGQVLELTEEDNKRLLRRIDWNLMPIM